MQHLILSLCLATVCLLLRAGASTDTALTCGAHVHRLECDSGVISVDAAFYGRKDQTTCAGNKTAEEVANTVCSHSTALDVLKRRCNGKEWCELNANVMDDPCSDTFKYLETTYSCVPAIHRIVCEHSIAKLHCDAPKVIHVLGADFGRRDHTTCSFRQQPQLVTKTDCSKPTDALEKKCNGKQSCEMRASYLVIEEQCVDTSLYLEYAYTCDVNTKFTQRQNVFGKPPFILHNFTTEKKDLDGLKRWNKIIPSKTTASK